MRNRLRRAYRKLAGFYGGWRLSLVLVGLAVLGAAAVFEAFPGWAAVAIVWLITLLLIGLQRTPPVTMVVPRELAVAPTPQSKIDTDPLVTVVVTTFNEGAFLSQCLLSVQGQNHTRLECIVVDDASTDDSVATAMAGLGGDPRFRLIRNPTNRGLAASRNVGLEAAQGLMVTFLDGDDFLFPNSLGERVAAFESAIDNGTLGGSFCNWVMVPETEVPGSEPPQQRVRHNVTWLSAVEDNPVIASAPLILTSSARAVGGFNESLVTAEDFDFWARYLRHGFALRAAAYVGVAYRQKKASMYRTTIQDHVDIQLEVYGFNFRHMDGKASTKATPFLFTDPPGFYQQQLMRARRLCVGVIVATHDRNTEAAQRLLASFAASTKPWMLWAEDWNAIIEKTTSRLEAYSSVGSAVRIADLRRRAESQILPLLIRSDPDKSAE